MCWSEDRLARYRDGSSLLKKIIFTQHAKDKFQLLKNYGFSVSEAVVRETLSDPVRVDRRNNQLLALRPINQEHALRVVYRLVNDKIVVVTFYPVKRSRFNV